MASEGYALATPETFALAAETCGFFPAGFFSGDQFSGFFPALRFFSNAQMFPWIFRRSDFFPALRCFPGFSGAQIFFQRSNVSPDFPALRFFFNAQMFPRISGAHIFFQRSNVSPDFPALRFFTNAQMFPRIFRRSNVPRIFSGARKIFPTLKGFPEIVRGMFTSSFTSTRRAPIGLLRGPPCRILVMFTRNESANFSKTCSEWPTDPQTRAARWRGASRPASECLLEICISLRVISVTQVH